jgi:NACalpha-BTF3-like transcription factor
MAEPQPPNAAEVEDQPAAPAAAEDRKAAAALDSLADDAPAASKSDADQKALGEAMDRLQVLEKSSKGADAAKGGAAKSEEQASKEAAQKKIKLDAKDVALLVESLEVSKSRAQEMLRAEDGDVQKTIGSWIKAGIPA